MCNGDKTAMSNTVQSDRFNCNNVFKIINKVRKRGF